MEVHGRHAGDLPPSRDQYLEGRDRLEHANRERIRRAREILTGLSDERRERIREARETELAQQSRRAKQGRAEEVQERRDVLELSTVDRFQPPDQAPARAERVEELRQEHEAGRLNTPERIEQAAQRILED